VSAVVENVEVGAWEQYNVKGPLFGEKLKQIKDFTEMMPLPFVYAAYGVLGTGVQLFGSRYSSSSLY
jgi:hypothetical protein